MKKKQRRGNSVNKKDVMNSSIFQERPSVFLKTQSTRRISSIINAKRRNSRRRSSKRLTNEQIFSKMFLPNGEISKKFFKKSEMIDVICQFIPGYLAISSDEIVDLFHANVNIIKENMKDLRAGGERTNFNIKGLPSLPNDGPMLISKEEFKVIMDESLFSILKILALFKHCEILRKYKISEIQKYDVGVQQMHDKLNAIYSKKQKKWNYGEKKIDLMLKEFKQMKLKHFRYLVQKRNLCEKYIERNKTFVEESTGSNEGKLDRTYTGIETFVKEDDELTKRIHFNFKRMRNCQKNIEEFSRELNILKKEILKVQEDLDIFSTNLELSREYLYDKEVLVSTVETLKLEKFDQLRKDYSFLLRLYRSYSKKQQLFEQFNLKKLKFVSLFKKFFKNNIHDILTVNQNGEGGLQPKTIASTEKLYLLKRESIKQLKIIIDKSSNIPELPFFDSELSKILEDYETHQFIQYFYESTSEITNEKQHVKNLSQMFKESKKKKKNFLKILFSFKGHENLIKLYLNFKLFSINEILDDQLNTILHYCCFFNHFEYFAIVLSYCNNKSLSPEKLLKCENEEGDTPVEICPYDYSQFSRNSNSSINTTTHQKNNKKKNRKKNKKKKGNRKNNRRKRPLTVNSAFSKLLVKKTRPRSNSRFSLISSSSTHTTTTTITTNQNGPPISNQNNNNRLNHELNIVTLSDIYTRSIFKSVLNEERFIKILKLIERPLEKQKHFGDDDDDYIDTESTITTSNTQKQLNTTTSTNAFTNSSPSHSSSPMSTISTKPTTYSSSNDIVLGCKCTFLGDPRVEIMEELTYISEIIKLYLERIKICKDTEIELNKYLGGIKRGDVVKIFLRFHKINALRLFPKKRNTSPSILLTSSSSSSSSSSLLQQHLKENNISSTVSNYEGGNDSSSSKRDRKMNSFQILSRKQKFIIQLFFSFRNNLENIKYLMTNYHIYGNEILDTNMNNSILHYCCFFENHDYIQFLFKERGTGGGGGKGRELIFDKKNKNGFYPFMLLLPNSPYFFKLQERINYIYDGTTDDQTGLYVCGGLYRINQNNNNNIGNSSSSSSSNKNKRKILGIFNWGKKDSSSSSNSSSHGIGNGGNNGNLPSSKSLFYFGEWKNGLFHGRGRLFYLNNNNNNNDDKDEEGFGFKGKIKYIGKFKRGKKDGKGKLYSEKGKVIIKGIWSLNSLKKKLKILPSEEEQNNFSLQVREIDMTEFKNTILMNNEKRTAALIGKGSFGEIYKYKNKFAFKYFNTYINEKDRKKIQSEIEMLCRIKHKNIIKCYGYSLKDPIGIVTELCQNSVADLIRQHNNNKSRKKKKLDWGEKLRIIYETSLGCEFLHFHHIIHRDLKWDNVLMDIKKRIKIIDFGFAKIQESYRQNSKTGTKQSFLGSFDYIAPEMCDGKYNNKVDVFAFGIMLFELIFQTDDPFEKATRNATSRYWGPGITVEVKNGLRPSFQSVDQTIINKEEWIIDLMKKCWQQDPKRRPSFSYILMLVSKRMKKRGAHESPYTK